MRALAKAKRVRRARAAARADLKRGGRRLSEIMSEEDVQGMALYDLLRWLPAYGYSTVRYPRGTAHDLARKLLTDCEATAKTTIGALGERRTALLLDAVKRRLEDRV